MKKIISLLLSITMILTMTIPAFATESIKTNSITYELTNTSFLDITETTQNTRTSTNSYEIKWVENDELKQVVYVTKGEDEVLVCNYENGTVTNTETISLNERITKVNSPKELSAQPFASVGSSVGYITYNANSLGVKERIRVYSKLDYSDYEAYTIRGYETDTIAMLVSYLIAKIVSWAAFHNFAPEIIMTIVEHFGGDISGGAIKVFFTEDVAVNASYYLMTGYDYSNNNYSSSYEGVARYVITQSSNYYKEWFYEGATPSTWKSEPAVPYWFWTDLFGTTYPGVYSYS